MPVSLPARFAQALAAWPWRRVGVLAAISLGLALLLVGYLFGVSDRFVGRLFPAFCVLFWLLAVVFLAVVPFVTWATRQWFGRGWREASAPARRAVPRPVSSHAAASGSKKK